MWYVDLVVKTGWLQPAGEKIVNKMHHKHYSLFFYFVLITEQQVN